MNNFPPFPQGFPGHAALHKRFEQEIVVALGVERRVEVDEVRRKLNVADQTDTIEWLAPKTVRATGWLGAGTPAGTGQRQFGMDELPTLLRT